MPSQINNFLLLLIMIILFIFSSSGNVHGIVEVDTKSKLIPVHQGTVHQVKTRKLMTADTVQDYDYPGPNPKHDPRNKGKPPVGGGGFRTP